MLLYLLISTLLCITGIAIGLQLYIDDKTLYQTEYSTCICGAYIVYGIVISPLIIALIIWKSI